LHFQLEHQLAQMRRENRSNTVSTNVSDLLDDIETDKISPKNRMFTRL